MRYEVKWPKMSKTGINRHNSGSMPGVWEGSYIRGAEKVFYLFKYPSFSVTIVGYHTKVVTFCTPRKWLFLLDELWDFSGNHHNLNAPYIINSPNFENGSKRMSPHF